MTRLTWIVFFFIIAGVVVSLISKKESENVKGVLIDVEALPTGDRLIDSSDIILIIERSFGMPLEAMPLGSVDIERLERVLVKEPFIWDANVFVDANEYVHITVEPREPILRIIDNNGQSYYLDKEGVRMPLSEHFSAKVLVASGNIPPFIPDYQKKEKHTLTHLYEFAQKVQEDDFLQHMVEQLYINNRREWKMAPKIGNQKILLGRYSSKIDDKIERLKVYYKEIPPYKGWQKYREIDLRFDGQVVCR